MKKLGTFKLTKYVIGERNKKNTPEYKKYLEGYERILEYNAENAVKHIHKKGKKLLLEESIRGTVTFYEITKKEMENMVKKEKYWKTMEQIKNEDFKLNVSVVNRTKTPKGWHKFSDDELPKHRIDDATGSMIIGSWVNYSTDDMVNLYQTDEKKPFLVWTTAEGRLSKVKDKSFTNAMEAKDYAIELMESIIPQSKVSKELADKTIKEKTKQIKDAVEGYKEELKKAHKRTSYLHFKYMLDKKIDYPEEVKKYSKEVGYDLDKIAQKDLLDEANLFEIDEKTKWILQMTNNEIFERQLPYPKVMLDCDLKLDNLWFRGFLVTKTGYTWTYWGEKDLLCTNPLIFNAFSKEQEKVEKYLQKDINKSTIKKLKVFVCNFFDFINNPEVRIIKLTRSEKNRQRRIREGKEPLPSTNKIRIMGTLKTYLEKPEWSGEHFNYRFWVRGHFMRFWNKKRFTELYKKLEQNNLPNDYYVDDKIRHHQRIIMRWKKPFVKGSGVLVSKRYEVKK